MPDILAQRKGRLRRVALRAGAKGYVMKQEEPEMLLRPLRQVLRGQVYLGKEIKGAIVNRLGGVSPPGLVPGETSGEICCRNAEPAK